MPIRRVAILLISLTIALTPLFPEAARAQAPARPALDVVIVGGRVIDPEKRLRGNGPVEGLRCPTEGGPGHSRR
jgi:hypothetical protein